MIKPQNIFLYRLLHWQNVEHVLNHGLCCREHPLSDPNYINIGHSQLINDRHSYPIPIPNAGSLGDYVPFYFAGHSPMLFSIMNGYKGVIQINQEELVYIVTSYKKIKEHQLEFIFTDRNAKIAIANFFTSESDFDKIQWDIVQNKIWKNDAENLARRDLKQAEFLVKGFVPIACIEEIVVKNEAKKLHFEDLIKNIGLDIVVKQDISSKLYY